MILAIGTYENSGGLRTLTESYYRSLGALGWNVHWLMFGTDTPPPAAMDRSYVRIPDPWRYYVEPGAVDAGALREVENLVEKLNPELLFRPLQLSYEPYLSTLKIPTLKTVHLVTAALIESAEQRTYRDDTRVCGSIAADRIRAVHERNYLHHAELLIVNSRTSFKDLERHYSGLRAQIALTPPGAEDAFFGLARPDLARTVLYFGRFNHQKGIPSLFHPVPPGWSMTCMGSGKWDRQDFAPFGIHCEEWRTQENVTRVLSRHSFCVFPSHYEPWGLSLNEALAAGRICVAQAGAGGHEEQIEHGRNGFLIDFEKRSFWTELEGILSLGEPALRSVSETARLRARRWRDHIEDLETLAKAWRTRGSLNLNITESM
jgi:glycosyltransferase involved in cell wall biosynthesis